MALTWNQQAPWRREPAVCEFIHRTRKELGVAA
jgi:hypothetical protein